MQKSGQKHNRIERRHSMASLIERRKMMQLFTTHLPLQKVTRLIVPQGAYIDSGLNADYLLNMTIEKLLYTGGAINGFGAITTLHGTQRYHMDQPNQRLRIGASTEITANAFFSTNLSIIRPADGYYNINGTESSFTPIIFDCYKNMILFARGREGSSTMEFASWYLDGRIWLQRGATERDYYPVICTEEVENVRGVLVPAGTAGLWNTIDNTFWTSDSATEFQYIP